MRNLVLVGAVALAACSPPAQQPAQAPTPSEAPLELTCAAFAGANRDTLIDRFGADNMRDEMLPGVEGAEYQATTIFPEDRRRRIEVQWVDPAVRDKIFRVSISGGQSGWRGPAGVALGMSLPEVQAANGAAFTVGGFGWDMGGWAGNWNGGALESSDCHVGVSFRPRGDYANASGDRQFASDSAEMRAADPRVMLVSVTYPQQQ